jgi:hypothetical protein
MTFQLIALVMTCAGCLLGIRFIFAGASVLKEWGVQETAGSLVVFRRIGAIYLGLALMFFNRTCCCPLGSPLGGVSGYGRRDRAARVSRALGVPGSTSQRWRFPLGRRGGGARGRLRLGVVGRAMMAPTITLPETNRHARFQN